MGTSRQAVVAGSLLLVATAVLWASSQRAASRAIDGGFWFEPVTFQSSRLGEPLTEAELRTIASVASSELTSAFEGLRITFTDRRDATYVVRVAHALRDLRTEVGVAGESRRMAGFGGSGAVSFDMLAAFAVAYAPDDADRSTIVAAIGRGVGRSAVHEFAHLLLGSVNIHDTEDVLSYEYPSAGRREHYYGEMRWDVARPLLQQRLGSVRGVQLQPD